MITLRQLEMKDAPFMYEWMTEPEITKFFRFDASKLTQDDCRRFIADAQMHPSEKHFAIANENDEYLGTISLKNIDSDRKEAEYAISTRKKAHGTGAALEATRQLLRYAFSELGLERVYLNVLVENGRANAFYRKAGFRFVREEPDAVQIRGEWKALNWYEATRREAESRQSGF